MSLNRSLLLALILVLWEQSKLPSKSIALQENSAAETSEERQKMWRGPLRIYADQTLSKKMGKLVEAQGNVHVIYELESKDILDSFSQLARYDEEQGTGEFLGAPKAVWKRQDPALPKITLTANRILLKIKDEELLAQGSVNVSQASSTLKDRQVTYFNADKKMIALGERPEFDVTEIDHHTKISSRQITAWVEKKEIQFVGEVEGVVELLSR